MQRHAAMQSLQMQLPLGIMREPENRRESMTKDKDPKSHAWAVLLTAHATLIEKIEIALAEAKLPPLGWYDALWELEKAEGGRLRMHELARRIVLSRSNLTHPRRARHEKKNVAGLQGGDRAPLLAARHRRRSAHDRGCARARGEGGAGKLVRAEHHASSVTQDPSQVTRTAVRTNQSSSPD